MFNFVISMVPLNFFLSRKPATGLNTILFNETKATGQPISSDKEDLFLLQQQRFDFSPFQKRKDLPENLFACKLNKKKLYIFY